MAEEREDRYGAWPKTLDELQEYVAGLVAAEHDYNTSAKAMSKAALAAFNYVGSALGCTGFQAGWAGMDFLMRSRGTDGPIGVLDGEKLLYPQYDVEGEARAWIEEWRPIVAERAREKLAEQKRKGGPVHPDVLAHWQKLAAEVAADD